MNDGVPQLNLRAKRTLLERVHSISLTWQRVNSTPTRTNGGSTRLKGGGPMEMSETARVCGSKVPRSHRSPSDRAHDTIPFIHSFSLFFPSRDFIGLEFILDMSKWIYQCMFLYN